MANLDPSVAIPQLEEFLKSLSKAARLDLRFKVLPVSSSEQNYSADSGGIVPQLRVECDGPDLDILLGRGGELLDALEHLAAKVLKLHSDEQGLIAFDSNDYRALRAEELKLMAEAAADRVERSGTQFELNPMNSRDRRIVHLALKNRPGVRTESDGNGSHRRIVIHPGGRS